MLPPERVTEINEIIDRITRWARGREDIVGLLLVGSCARNAVRPDSDIDVVLLTTNESGYLREDAWAVELGLGELIRTQPWGPVKERRYATASGLEVELGIGSPAWAKTDPVDGGTRRVVTDGARVLHDPAGILADLLAACWLTGGSSDDQAEGGQALPSVQGVTGCTSWTARAS
ncbi:nucleotidyltransferase domain-containing protein [Streptomyces sp. NPDC001393]